MQITKIYFMAFLSLDTTWSGEYAPYLITKAMFSMDTMEKSIVAVETGIKKIKTIDRIDFTNPLSPSQAIPTNNPAIGFTIDSRTLIPGNFQSYVEVNPRDLEATQYSKQLADAILEEVIPDEIQSYMTMLQLNRCGESIETGLWQGSLAFAGHYVEGDANYQLQYFNGFMQRAVNDPAINLSSISPVTITASIIFSILDDLILQATTIEKALITDKESYKRMKFLVSAATWFIYTQALRNNAYKGLALDEGGTPMWGGWKVERLAGMMDNTIWFCRADGDPIKSNLWVGMNSEADWQIKIAPKEGNTFSEIWGMLLKMKWDVNYGWPSEIFMYTTATKANFLPPVTNPQ
jgi:hypothetical protein